MTVTLYANGTGGTLGDELVTETELYTSGFVYFVHHSGSNSNGGGVRQKPWSSLVFALTQVTDNDVIVLMDGHAETISAAQTITQNGLKVVGEGSDSGVPTVTLTSNLTNQSMLTLEGINIALGNIRFPEGGANTSVARISVTGVRSMIRGCYIEIGAADEFSGVSLAATAHGARVYDTKVVVTSTTTPPGFGIVSTGPTDCELEAVTFDGGVVGFSAGGFFDLSVLAGTAPERLRCQQIQLLNGAGFFTGSSTTGYIGISERTGAPAVQGFQRRLPNGFRQLGDALLADGEIYMSGDVLYVHYGTGDDANSGFDELAPKKTLASALSVTTTGQCDFVVLLPGHDEPVTAAVTMPTESVTIIGCGTSGGNPSCRLYQNAAGPFILLALDQVAYLRNVWINETTSGVTQAEQVSVGAAYSEIRGCLISSGYRDHIGALVTESRVTIRETKFESTDTGATTRALDGLRIESEGSVTDLDVRGCEFSNGAGGFTGYAFQEIEPVTRIYVIAMTQSFGADANFNGSTSGIVNPQTATGSAMVTW